MIAAVGNNRLRRAARSLLRDLRESRLHVAKILTRNGYVRVAVSQNAEWYQTLCRRYTTTRRKYPKERTIIKRCHTVRALERFIAKGDDGTEYVARLLPFVRDRRRQLAPVKRQELVAPPHFEKATA